MATTMQPVYYVGIIAQLLSYASFLSGAKVCHLIYRERSCAKLSPIPFLAGFNCMALWLRYGLLADEYEIIAVNFIGLTCQTIYLVFFVAYSKQKARVLKQWLVVILFIGLLFWIIERSSKEDRRLLGGSFASLAGLVACASPLATIQDVLKTRCVSSMPFPIIISSFVVTLSWLLFGLLKGDSFIVFSNLIAVIISGAQLSLFMIYPSKHAYEKLSPSNKKSYVSKRGLKLYAR